MCAGPCITTTNPCAAAAAFVQISTVNMGLAVGWSAVILGYGRKGLRKSLPHSLGESSINKCEGKSERTSEGLGTVDEG